MAKRTIDPEALAAAIDHESASNPIAGIPSMITTPYGGKNLTKTDALLQAAVMVAEQEAQELRDAGYTINPLNPVNLLKTIHGPIPHFTRILRAIDTAAEEERFND